MITLILAGLIVAQAPNPAGVETLAFDQARLATIDRVEVRVVEDGKPVTYSGVPLASLLKPGAMPVTSMQELRALADDVILLRGGDGYQTTVSAVAAAMDTKGERYLLALSRDGKPLDAASGPVRLIVPGDPRHVRWVKGVASIRLVKLDQLVPAP